MQEQTARILNPEEIEILPNWNPRRLLDKKELERLAESVRLNGVIQAITVRPSGNGAGYFVISGHRRLLAAKRVGAKTIPAIVSDVSETQAREMALIENDPLLRINMSPVEESLAARKILDECNGDIEDTLKRLGWSRKKYESRKLLLNASPAVQEALIARHISIGHAELLAQLPEKTQEGTVRQIIERKISVDELRRKISSIALSLDKAFFSASACAACAHNSSVAVPLFSETIQEGRCQDIECYNRKTQEALNQRKEELKQAEYNAVFLDTEKDPGSFAVVYATGENGVGSEQFASCRACASFGALVCTRPGSVGRVTEDVCFDAKCNRKRFKAYQSSLTAQASSEAPGPNGSEPTAKTAPNPAKNQGTKKAAKPTKAGALPTAVGRQIDTFFRTVAVDVIETDRQALLATVMFALLKDAGFPGKIVQQAGISSFVSDRPRALAQLYGLDSKAANDLIKALCKHIYAPKDTEYQEETLTRASVAIAQASEISLEKAFKLDAAFLGAYTKSGIHSLLVESGFAAYYSEKHGEKGLKTLLAEKKELLIKKVLEDGYNFSGFVPGVVSGRLAK